MPSAKAAGAPNAGHAAKSPPPASSQPTLSERRPSQSYKEDKAKNDKKKEKEVVKDVAPKDAEQSPQAKAAAPRARQEEEEERKREERRQEREDERHREEEAKKDKRAAPAPVPTPADGDTFGKKREGKAKAAQPPQSQEKSAAFSKPPPAHPPAAPPAQPLHSEKKIPPQPQQPPAQPPAQPPLQPPTLPPAQPPVPAHPPAVPLNSMWADHSHKPTVNVDYAGPPEETAMALPPPPSIPPPPAPGNMAGKAKAISPAPPTEMDPMRMQRPPPGIDLGLLLTGPAPGLSPQPVLPPPGISKPNDSTSLAPAEAAAVSAVQGLGTDSFFGGAPGLDFGGLNGLGAIGFPPGISPKQPQRQLLLQRPASSIPGMPVNAMPEDFYPVPDTTNRLGMFQQEPPASSSLFSSPFGMFGPIGSHSQGLK